MAIQFKLRRRKNSPNWIVQHYVPGAGYTRYWSTGTPDKALAKKRMDAYAAEVLRVANKPEGGDEPKDLSIDTVLDIYQQDHGEDLNSKGTAERIFRHLTEYYAGKTVASLTLSTHKAYEHDMRKAGWSAATINRARNTLRAALKHAVKNGDLRFAPHVPSLKVTTKKERWLSRHEAACLLWACHARRYSYLAMFIRLGLYCGARHEAILELAWDRVDLEVGTVDFRNPTKPETNKRRPHGPVAEKVVAALRRHRTRQLDDAARLGHGRRPTHVVEHRGGPLVRIDDAFREACKRAGLKGVTPHVLKHTAISWFLRSGMPPWQVAGLTATSLGTIEKTYGHHAQTDLRDAVNRAARSR